MNECDEEGKWAEWNSWEMERGTEALRDEEEEEEEDQEARGAKLASVVEMSVMELWRLHLNTPMSVFVSRYKGQHREGMEGVQEIFPGMKMRNTCFRSVRSVLLIILCIIILAFGIKVITTLLERPADVSWSLFCQKGAHTPPG